jgi:hypothetical protein
LFSIINDPSGNYTDTSDSDGKLTEENGMGTDFKEKKNL